MINLINIKLVFKFFDNLDCILNHPVREILVNAKDCPSCGVMTEKIDGCNHITCTNCNTHWCFLCKFVQTPEMYIYNHLSRVHGGFYEDDENENDNMDDMD